MREYTVEDYLRARCRYNSLFIRKMKFIGQRGAPDQVIILPEGRVIWVELKSPRGRISQHQLIVHNKLRELGHQVEVMNNKEKVDDLLNSICSN